MIQIRKPITFHPMFYLNSNVELIPIIGTGNSILSGLEYTYKNEKYIFIKINDILSEIDGWHFSGIKEITYQFDQKDIIHYYIIHDQWYNILNETLIKKMKEHNQQKNIKP